MNTLPTTTTEHSDLKSSASRNSTKTQTTFGTPDDEPWIGTSAGAKFLGASVPTFRRWIKQGLVNVRRTPTGELRFRRSDLNKLIS